MIQKLVLDQNKKINKHWRNNIVNNNIKTGYEKKSEFVCVPIQKILDRILYLDQPLDVFHFV